MAVPVEWSSALIATEKAAAKRVLDAAAPAGRARLTAALQHVTRWHEDDSPLGRLRCYVFIMSALVQHERSGGLSQRQVKRLVAWVHAILQAQGIRPRDSRLAALYGDIHIVRSQIFRKDGEPWQAAWEQQIALQLGGDDPTGGDAFQLLCMANRALRLGHSRVAVYQLKQAETLGLSSIELARARLSLIRAQWFLGDDSAVVATIAATRSLPGLRSDIAEEIDWIEMVRAVQRSGDVGPMLRAVGRHGAFHKGTYVIEACLWAMSVPQRSFLAAMPRMDNLLKNKLMSARSNGLWFSATAALQDCYDAAIPLAIRTKRLGDCLLEKDKLLTVDKELMIWAAALRWLSRSKNQSLALLVFSEYRALCLRLSDGRSGDILNVAADLASRSWLKAATIEEESGEDTRPQRAS